MRVSMSVSMSMAKTTRRVSVRVALMISVAPRGAFVCFYCAVLLLQALPAAAAAAAAAAAVVVVTATEAAAAAAVTVLRRVQVQEMLRGIVRRALRLRTRLVAGQRSRVQALVRGGLLETLSLSLSMALPGSVTAVQKMPAVTVAVVLAVTVALVLSLMTMLPLPPLI